MALVTDGADQGVPSWPGRDVGCGQAFHGQDRARGLKPQTAWSRGGQLALDRELPAGATFLAGEPKAGWISVGYHSLIEGRQRTAFVAIADGSVIREEPALLPAAGPGWNQDQTLPAGSPGTRLFVGAHGELVRLDPETGRREAVLVPPIPGGGKPQW